MSETIEEGAKAPAFTLEMDDGEKLSLKDLKGQKVVLYFYPRDDTPGCTKEAIAFSKDSIAKHQKFRNKHGLKVALGSDENSDVAERFGVWVEKNMYGKKYMGIERSTFLIDEKGVVRKVWRKVKVPGHSEAVLEAVKGL